MSHHKFHTLSDHRFPRQLDPRAQRDRYIGAEPKAKVIRLTLCNRVEHCLRGTFEFNQHFGCCDRHSLTSSNVEWDTSPSRCVDMQPDRGECLYLRIRGNSVLTAVPPKLTADDIGGSERPHGPKSPLLLVSQCIQIAGDWCL